MGKIKKEKVLKALKEYKFNEKEKVKRAELIEAIKNANEDSIELIEHKAKLQVGYMEMDITMEGSRTSSGDISVTTTTTYNQQIKSARHVWLVEGDVKVAEMSELRNGLSPTKESTRTIDMSSKFYGQYVYRAQNENSATSLIGINYAKSYLRKLNLTYRSSRVNAFQFVPESDPYELSYWEIYFTYTTSKGKKKRISIGNVFQRDLSQENDIEIQFPFQKKTDANKIGSIIKYVLIGVAVLALVIWLILR